MILAAGALVTRKGFDVLIEAAASSPAAAAGRGYGLPATAINARACRSARAATAWSACALLGRRSDVPCLLAACDIFCMPSLREGLGIAALEAMAAGRAVVASRVGGLGQAVDDGRTGLLVPPGDAPALAAALERLLRDSNLRGSLAAAGPEHVARDFSVGRMVAQYERVYRTVLEELGRS